MLPFVSVPHFQIISESHRFKMIGLFASNLTVKSFPSRMISISFESSSAELARDTNTLASYINRTDKLYRENGELQAEWLDDRLSQTSKIARCRKRGRFY